MGHTITKEFRFEAAHRLTTPYRGKCQHLHGHSFIVKVSVSAHELDECGFVRDFASLSPLKEWIMSNLDHATLVSERDSELISFLRSSDQKHYAFPVNPTSEVLAQSIFMKASELGFEPSAVEIMETCTSAARFTK